MFTVIFNVIVVIKVRTTRKVSVSGGSKSTRSSVSKLRVFGESRTYLYGSQSAETRRDVLAADGVTSAAG